MGNLFSCSRGVRQGDLLLPLFFCIDEEVLSRGISHLVDSNPLNLIKGTRNNHTPYHSSYEDNVMIFCTTSSNNIQVLTRFFDNMLKLQVKSKSTIYGGSISHIKLTHIATSICFNIRTIPFTYLGVPIFKGKLRRNHFDPIMDKTKVKMAS